MALQEPDTPGAVLRYHQFKVSGELFECPSTYRPLKPVGKGAYGLVCAASDARRPGKRVAIKKVSGMFASTLDARRTLREIQILRFLGGRGNVVELLDVFPPLSGGRSSFSDVYVVQELADTDLHQIIRSPQTLGREHVRFFAYQTLRGLKYIHSAGVVHRDLKPSNLLVNANCDLRLCDFGLARADDPPAGAGPSGRPARRVAAAAGAAAPGGGADPALAGAAGDADPAPGPDHPPLEYVVTRWYRAPELLLSCADQGPAVDVWSAGCVLAELLGRKPLFPGKDYLHQLALVCRVLGTPPPAYVDSLPRAQARAYLRSVPRMPPADPRDLFPDAPPGALDLLVRLLAFDPAARPTAAQALRHPFFAGLHDPEDEPDAPGVFRPSPAERGGVHALRRAIFDEMATFNPDLVHLNS